MIKLVGNELYKVFHKKMFYILSIVFLVLTAGLMILNQALSGSALDDMVMPMYEQQLDMYNLDNAEEAAVYVSLKNMVEINRIFKEKNIDYYSPEGFYLYNDISEMMGNQLTAKYVEKDEEKANQLQVQLDEAIKSLDNYDWRKSLEKELEIYKASLNGEEVTEDEKVVINETIKVIQYRLENNIPESFRAGSLALDDYLGSFTQYQQLSKKDDFYVDKSKLYEKKRMEAAVEEGKYKLEHKLFTNNKSNETAQSGFVDSVSSLSIFITVCVLMIAGSIISEEYNKGTIKQLLTRPYTRTKIFASKFIATLITVLIFILFTTLVQTVVSGIMTNSFGTLNDPIVHYNITTNSIVVTNTITEYLAYFAAILPAIVILTTFTLLVSILTGQTATSVVLGFVLIFIPNLFSLLLDRVSLLSYLPMFNWDLTTYLFGGMSPYKFNTFGKAIVVDVVTIILLIVGGIILFKKKDIKNQ